MSRTEQRSIDVPPGRGIMSDYMYSSIMHGREISGKHGSVDLTRPSIDTIHTTDTGSRTVYSIHPCLVTFMK